MDQREALPEQVVQLVAPPQDDGNGRDETPKDQPARGDPVIAAHVGGHERDPGDRKGFHPK